MQVRYDRLILGMADDDLEAFCRSWVEKKDAYFEVKRYAGAGDQGRDVVGFESNKRHEGVWDNYQCKQLRSGVAKSHGLLAIGKVLYWAWKKEFTAPRHFYFVAPKGLAGNLQSLLDKPSELKQALLDEWDSVCGKSITKKEVITLEPTLKLFIENHPFENISSIDIDGIMKDPAVKPLLIDKYGADPGKYPAATVPLDVQTSELPYVDELVFAYGERSKVIFPDHVAVLAHVEHGSDLKKQRERFYEADAFQKFYRDNTFAEIIVEFRKEIEHGVFERWNATSPDTLARVETVMTHAGTLIPSGKLSQYAAIPVKQGICHHFVNDGEKSWKKK